MTRNDHRMLRVSSHATGNAASDSNVNIGNTTSERPNTAATPFPPPKRRNTVKLWPIVTASAAAVASVLTSEIGIKVVVGKLPGGLRPLG